MGSIEQPYKLRHSHPLDPITATEVQVVASLIRKKFKDVKLRFQQIDLQEPRKEEMITFLDAERRGELPESTPSRIARCYIWLYTEKQESPVDFHKMLVDITFGKIVDDTLLPAGIQAPIHGEEMIGMEVICLEHPAIKKEIERLQIPSGYKVCLDPWMYGTQSSDNKRRLFQCYMYVTIDCETATNESNHYARPLDFSPVFDGHTHELVEIIRLPMGLDHTTSSGLDPWEQVSGCEYDHNLTTTGFREDCMKPLIVQQPEGPSFTVKGREVSWQKWNFRVGFNLREGLVIQNVSYDGRPLFYRLSVCEMTVPYGDPRSPYHRKQAFDFGDVGIGLMANKLGLGCDCLGTIKYFDGVCSNGEGQAVELKNVICMHEVDEGILWKHVNYRNDKARCIRNRKLVVQTIATVGNYEYIFAWEFDMAANVHLETRATGILSTMPISASLINGTTQEGRENAKHLGFGTVVSEGVMAANHQHIFSVRIDPMIDGHKNLIVQEESHALPDNDENPWGVGYTSVKTPILSPSARDLDINTSRTFFIQNPNKFNRISGKPVSYKLHAHPSQMMIMNPSSYSYKRAYFTHHPIFITRYRDDEVYPAGEFTNQSTTDTGLSVWSTRPDTFNGTEGDDVVLWHTWSLTHNPRPEDFPVMPSEIVKVSLKPSNFFEMNPANDVRPAEQSVSQSVLVSDGDGVANGAAVNSVGNGLPNGTNGCCA